MHSLTEADVSFEATELNRQKGMVCNLGQIDGKVTVGTINAHGKIEAKADIKGLTGTSASLKASAGAEAMAIDGHAGFEVSLTPKTIGDTLGG